jgi:SAM-dependent methyltransferase
MAPVLITPETSPLVRALLADLGVEEGGVDLAIDPDDEMLGFLLESNQGDRDRALWAYFQSGASIAASMAQVLAWRFGAPGKVGRLLDFASGYGRVTRFLLRQLPAERIGVADIYAAGVRFQEQRFGVRGIVSTVRPEDLDAGAGAYDAILVTSLFTHLPEERFVAWLRVLMGLLAPGGVLAFSVHDQALLPLGAQLPAGGILFQEISESGSLATHDYGSTWVSEAFVHGALARARSGGEVPAGSLHRLPGGLCNYQDLYIAVPEAGADFSRLRYRGEPRLFVERCAVVKAGLLELRGWAGMVGSGSVAAVEVLLDDHLLARLAVEHDRPEVAALLGDLRLVRSGWAGACQLPPATSRSQSVLRLRLVDDMGHVHPEFASTLEAALHASTRLDVTVVERELHRVEAIAARQAAEAAALGARIAAMEASRFWKLRNAWFRLKGWLGLGEG